MSPKYPSRGRLQRKELATSQTTSGCVAYVPVKLALECDKREEPEPCRNISCSRLRAQNSRTTIHSSEDSDVPSNGNQSNSKRQVGKKVGNKMITNSSRTNLVGSKPNPVAFDKTKFGKYTRTTPGNRKLLNVPDKVRSKSSIIDDEKVENNDDDDSDCYFGNNSTSEPLLQSSSRHSARKSISNILSSTRSRWSHLSRLHCRPTLSSADERRSKLSSNVSVASSRSRASARQPESGIGRPGLSRIPVYVHTPDLLKDIRRKLQGSCGSTRWESDWSGICRCGSTRRSEIGSVSSYTDVRAPAQGWTNQTRPSRARSVSSFRRRPAERESDDVEELENESCEEDVVLSEARSHRNFCRGRVVARSEDNLCQCRGFRLSSIHQPSKMSLSESLRLKQPQQGQQQPQEQHLQHSLQQQQQQNMQLPQMQPQQGLHQLQQLESSLSQQQQQPSRQIQELQGLQHLDQPVEQQVQLINTVEPNSNQPVAIAKDFKLLSDNHPNLWKRSSARVETAPKWFRQYESKQQAKEESKKWEDFRTKANIRQNFYLMATIVIFAVFGYVVYDDYFK